MLHDWNNNGERDMVDSFIDYQIYKEVMKKENRSNNPTPFYSGGISGIGILISLFLGIIVTGRMLQAVGLEIEDVPSLILIILCLVVCTGFIWIADKLGI